MGEQSFELGGKQYKLSKIDALKQFHVVRRVAPLLAEFLPVMSSISKMKVESLSEDQKLEEFGKLAAPIMTGLSKLSDADADFVLFRLLSCVEVQQPEYQNSWARVASDAGIMMQNIELPVLMQLAGRAFMYNLAGFFGSPLRK